MGYYTQYTIWAEIPGNERDVLRPKIADAMDHVYGGGFEYDGDVEWAINAKWYECDVDMYEMSLVFPSVIFHVHGDGDDSDDLWEAHYHDGSMQRCCADIPPYDPAQMVKMQLSKPGQYGTRYLEKAPPPEPEIGSVNVGDVV